MPNQPEIKLQFPKSRSCCAAHDRMERPARRALAGGKDGGAAASRQRQRKAGSTAGRLQRGPWVWFH
ncbi:MAG TPA: hypothetical protein VJ964_15000 [Balneolaceae bacterium]|nr:hypothetical protein [Balneolaceae bacterium]